MKLFSIRGSIKLILVIFILFILKNVSFAFGGEADFISTSYEQWEVLYKKVGFSTYPEEQFEETIAIRAATDSISGFDESRKIDFDLQTDVVKPTLKSLIIPADLNLRDIPIIDVTNEKPSIDSNGEYTFAIGTTEAGTLNFLSNIAVR